jgi:hypothetical protein
MTPADVLAAVRQGTAPVFAESGVHTIVRFGLFTGNVAVVGPPPNHTLEGSQVLADVPTWLVIGSNVPLFVSGPARPTTSADGQPTTTLVPRGFAVTVVNDSDGQVVNGLYESSVDPAVK